MPYFQYLIRRDSAANWSTANPVLGQGELAAELDTGKLKIGDGTTAWDSLAYMATIPNIVLDDARWDSPVRDPGRFVVCPVPDSGGRVHLR